MYMITYKVAGTEGLVGTYGDIEEARTKLTKLQERYTETTFRLREVKNNNLNKYIEEGMFNGETKTSNM